MSLVLLLSALGQITQAGGGRCVGRVISGVCDLFVCPRMKKKTA